MRDGETEIEARERLTRNPIFNEDCLFLDVILPKKVFEKTKKTRKPGSHCPPKHGGMSAINAPLASGTQKS